MRIKRYASKYENQIVDCLLLLEKRMLTLSYRDQFGDILDEKNRDNWLDRIRIHSCPHWEEYPLLIGLVNDLTIKSKGITWAENGKEWLMRREIGCPLCLCVILFVSRFFPQILFALLASSRRILFEPILLIELFSY